MTQTYDLIIKQGTLVSHAGRRVTDIGIRDGRIIKLGDLSSASGGEVVDAKGLHVLPGVIDSQVHFREPGLEHKETLASGARGAVLGGVTSVFEMPNTSPPTDNKGALEDKLNRAKGRMACNYAFYAGASYENAPFLADMERIPGCCGVKIFMGSSTGSLLVGDDEGLARVLKHVRRRVAVHSEDEERLKERKHLAREGDWTSHPEVRDVETALKSTRRLLKLAYEYQANIHVLHVSTAEEIELLAAYKDRASVEVTPQHLTLVSPDAYERLGALAQMNPPIRAEHHRQGLWEGIDQGVVDVIGSDHAPHTLEEKARPYPASPSGMTGVQTLVPVMLNHVNAGRLTLERFVDLTSHGPARVFGIRCKGRLAVGYDADITLVDMEARRTISNDWIASLSGWTSFDGVSVQGWPMATVVGGRLVMYHDEILGEPQGRPISFF